MIKVAENIIDFMRNMESGDMDFMEQATIMLLLNHQRFLGKGLIS